MDLREHSDDELLSATRRLVGAERKLTAKLVAYLAEIEERRLHLIAGYSSMFDFCTRALGLSENEAFRRVASARLGRRFPIVLSLLASGAVHLSALELLREHLTDDNHRELLEITSGKSKREVEALLAARFPRPDAPARIRQLSEQRFKVEFTATAELRDKLERCRDLMSHANPSRDVAAVIERAVDLLLVDLERTRLKRTKRPRRESPTIEPPSTDRVSNAIRRDVFERDGTQCTYVSPDGRRCEAHAFLELDHEHPRALGGENEARNLRVLCRAHNQLRRRRRSVAKRWRERVTLAGQSRTLYGDCTSPSPDWASVRCKLAMPSPKLSGRIRTDFPRSSRRFVRRFSLRRDSGSSRGGLRSWSRRAARSELVARHSPGGRGRVAPGGASHVSV